MAAHAWARGTDEVAGGLLDDDMREEVRGGEWVSRAP